MQTKNLIIVIIVLSAVGIIAAYFFTSQPQAELPKASYTASDKARPIVSVPTKSADMGKMKVSEERKKEFKIKNIGTKPLQLTDISTSCGCTVAQIIYQGRESKEFGMHAQGDYEGVIQPNTEAIVRLIYRPFVMPVYGVVEREAYFSTNDPSQPKLVFSIKAFVQ